MHNDSGLPLNNEPGELQISVTVGGANFSADGAGHLVMKAVHDFYEMVRKMPVATTNELNGPDEYAAPPSPTQLADVDPIQGTNEAGSSPLMDEPLPVFLRSHPSLKTNHQVAAGIAVWNGRVKGTDELNADDFEKLWRISGRKVPTNIPRDVGKAVKEGWLQRTTSGLFQTTTYGERYVDDQRS